MAAFWMGSDGVFDLAGVGRKEILMLKTVFNFNNLLLGGVYIFLGISMAIVGSSSSDPKSQAYGLLGTIVVVGALVIVLKDTIDRLRGIHYTRRSPEYEAMKADFAIADSFMEKKVFVGKKYVFSAYAGIIVRCEDFRNPHYKIHQYVRGGNTVELIADIPEKEDATIAIYSYRRDSADEYNRFLDALWCAKVLAEEEKVKQASHENIP